MDKSYVTMEQHVCPICGKAHDTGAILLDQRLRKLFDQRTATGWGLCPEHAEIYADGFIALVEVKGDARDAHRATLKPEEADRTGRIVHLRFGVASQLFNIPLSGKDGRMLPFVFCSPEVTDVIIKRCKDAGVDPVPPEQRSKTPPEEAAPA